MRERFAVCAIYDIVSACDRFKKPLQSIPTGVSLVVVHFITVCPQEQQQILFSGFLTFETLHQLCGIFRISEEEGRKLIGLSGNAKPPEGKTTLAY